ncbi:DUF2199 domain-containing protein [Amycolatopsis cynarae]|uniref:DUF2199 domain-containing protein n=1 Tax=Amycolatopsis cynarae TaxID=2995223 RepID=A0ABY7B529_9PSEU|nr:DUF2199 domain-containing protein [Amycolatopsis sp. HUAS 11-8]WAL65903.1 DUF2199 domain-containing protein [Amycolatopsis sp. HUAS 11-8]
MTSHERFRCTLCAEEHAGPPLSYGTRAPAYWRDDLASQPGNLLTADQCVIANEHFFIRARIVLPIVDSSDAFEWSAWVSLSPDNYQRACGLWNDPARVNERPYFGWLSTELTPYTPTTLNLKTMVHQTPVGLTPVVELEPTDHPLARQQRDGITVEQIQTLAEQLLHAEQS